MKTMKTMKATPRLAWLLLTTILTVPGFAQGQFIETFDAVGPVGAGQSGPQNLLADGWEFRNQSQPAGSSTWTEGSFFSPQAGAGNLETDSFSTSFFGGQISHWILLPPVAGQQAGDVLTFHARAVNSSNMDTLQVLYSPSGGTSTGLSPGDVGDFSTQLLDISPLSTTGWAAYSVTLPGSGRIALRYYVDSACNFGCSSSVVAIDTLSVGVPPAPPCNLPPMPSAGQTVSWTAADGPYRICSDVTVPVGSTVILEAGATINIDNGKTLAVAGTMLAEGTALSPVRFTGDFSLVTPPIEVFGMADLNGLEVSCRLHVANGGSLIVRGGSFDGGELSTDSSIGGPDRGTFVSVEDCVFSGGNGITLIDGTLALRSSSFLGGAAVTVLRGYLLAEAVVIDGSGLDITRERYAQPIWLDGLTITNSPGPALRLWGWNYDLGPSNVLQNCVYPVTVQGGLLSGSIVPTTGNVNNYVDVGDGGIPGSATWAALDVPYVVNGFAQTAGALEIEPGATVQFKPGSGVLYFSTGFFSALGTPAEPILFQEFAPGVGWDRLKFSSMVTGPRFEHVVIEDAQTAVQADDTLVQVDASVLRGNEIAGLGSTFGTFAARDSQYLNNTVAVQTTALGSASLELSTANSFSGNDLAVLSNGSVVPARDNWWGDPSGPQHVSNPSGQGDAVSGPVDVVPFLVAAPDHADSPPVLRMSPHTGQVAAGSKLLLAWDVEDDGAIVSQKVLFSQHGNLNYVVVADGLPGSQRSIELTVPTAFPSSDNSPSFFKVVATDDGGKEGFDEETFNVPYTEDIGPTTLTWLTDFSGPFTFGDELQVCWDYAGPSSTWSLSVIADSEGGGVGQGGGTTLSECWNITMPYISTDQARIAITFLIGAGGRTVTHYSPAFTLRPDLRLGDAPPVITMLSPSPQSSFAGGDSVPISWLASDDEALRSLAVQASYDGGLGWNTVVHGLPASATSYNWALPSSSGMADVRLRVIAHDLRYQNTSDTVAISVVPGMGQTCQADLGFGGPGNAVLSLCGDALATGKTADLLLSGAAPSSMAWLVAGLSSNPQPFKAGTLVPVPFLLAVPLPTDSAGTLSIDDMQGGGGPLDVYVQCVVQDPLQPLGFALSNALLVKFLP